MFGNGNFLGKLGIVQEVNSNNRRQDFLRFQNSSKFVRNATIVHKTVLRHLELTPLLSRPLGDWLSEEFQSRRTSCGETQATPLLRVKVCIAKA